MYKNNIMASPSSVATVPRSKNITDLTQLLTSCIDQLQLLENPLDTNSDHSIAPFSSVYFLALAALQDHATWQLTQLQTQIQHLQTQQRDYQIACRQQQNELLKWETKVMQQKEEFVLLNKKNESLPLTPSSSFKHTHNADAMVGQSQSPSKATTTATQLVRPDSRKITTADKTNKTNNSRQKSPNKDRNSNSHLTSLERQKKAAMEERQQQVLEQRRKAAEEQKRLKEQEHSKFLEYEQRKEELKLQAQREAEVTKLKARQEEEALLEAMRQAQLWQATSTASTANATGTTSGTTTTNPSPSHHPNQTLSPSMSQYTTPLTTTPSSQPTPPMSSPATRFPSSRNNTTNSHGSGQRGSGLGGTGGVTTSVHRGNAMEIPHLPQKVPQMSHNTSQPLHPGQQQRQQQQQPPTPHHHTPTGTDAKYSRMMSQQPIPPPTLSPANSSDQMDSPSQEAITSLKYNILLHWALLPPNYQVLKPIPQLLCQIHTVLPPAFGVSAHTYFEGYTSKPIMWQDLIATNTMGQATTTWDAAKLKKAVRTVRFFLHPDKLPHDLNGLQQFVCKLLWDVINDAFEDYQKQPQQQ